MNLKKILVGFVASAVMLGSAAAPAFAVKPTDKGFDEFGYNDTARNFVGTAGSWCQAKTLPVDCQGTLYTNDNIVMKWNAEWDRGNDEGWTNGPYRAWTDNEWNGRADGSGEVWHYKIVWVGDYSADSTLVPDGAYGIWGQFAVVMDNGSNADRVHTLMHSSPSGYGAF